MTMNYAEVPTNGAADPNNRLALNRLGPQKASGSPVLKKAADSLGATEDIGQSRLNAKKMAEQKARARTLARGQAVAERLSAATEQVASAIAEATSSVEEMEKTMHSIAAGADESSAAAEESRAAINQIEKASDTANGRAEVSLRRVNEVVALAQSTTVDIEALIRGVRETAEANTESSKKISELERQSEEISKIVHAVTRIADQTNLLALNAAIEAARAGEHGKGFAVVADEVRNLAEISEKCARGIQEVVNEIQNQVKVVAGDTEAAGKKGREEVERAKVITQDLQRIGIEYEGVRANCAEIQKSAANTLSGAKDYLRGAEEIAAAAEETSSACEEAQKSTQEQSKAYAEMSDAARSLAETAEALKTSTNAQKSAEELAATAEQLSSNAEELKASSQQISLAIDQINKAAADQAKAAEASNVLGEQMRRAARNMGESAEASVEKAMATQKLLATNKSNVDALIINVGKSADAAAESVKNILELQERTRRIDKIVDAIVMVTVQTKMLAVNGNVEAARAGEYGRGFSVVAGDIRSLANESSENADRIKDLVRNVQAQITKVAGDIELAGSRGRAEVERTKASTANLERISTESEVVVADIREVAKASGETSAGLEEAGKASQQIATAAEQTARASIEAATAADQSMKAAQEIAQAIEDIASQADELQNG
jgi:methyl-accepting chemotaxis protein